MSKIIDAVSIILTYQEEIFLVERQHYLSAFPGYISFPGGKVEEGDEKFLNMEPYNKIPNQILGAAIREGEEELGINLGNLFKEGKIISIDSLGVAVTPEFNPYRFATHFLRFRLKEKPQLQVDANEARCSYWLKAHVVRERFEKGELLAVPPVRKTCMDLGENIDVTSIKDLNVVYDPKTEVPHIGPLCGIIQIMPLSHTLPPATRTNAFLLGDNQKILIDPSPKDEEEYQKLKNTVLKFGVDEIFITHHHPDHFEYSNLLALELGIPISLSRDTQNRILNKHPNFFDGIKLINRKEGDVITQWLGQRVLVYEVPGHDEGQLALAPENMNWFLAGDLFQGIGTVVIGGEEGNMRKYMQTLERIIKLSPRVVFPSHGIGLGGTYILEKTLAHRQEREKQILDLTLQNKSEDEILKTLYSEINPKLYPYARQNIQKHLEKLKEEGKI